MMLCLALRSDPERVYQRAVRQFSVQEISEGFAAARGLALPSQLRRMLREQGRDLHAEPCSCCRHGRTRSGSNAGACVGLACCCWWCRWQHS